MKKAKMIAGIVVIIVLLLGLVFGVLYFKTDILDFMKNPKDMFLKYSANMFGITDKKGDKSEGNLINRSFIQNTKLSYDYSIEDSEYASMSEMKAMIEVINASTLNTETKYDSTSKSISSNVDLKYEDKSIGNLIVSFEKAEPERISVGLPNIIDEGLAVENRDLKALVEKFGGDSTYVPDKLNFINYEDVMFTDEELADIKERYIKIVLKGINEENIERTSEEIEFDGKEIKTKAYTLTITEKELWNIAAKLVEEFKEDDLMLDTLMTIIDALPIPYEELEMIKPTKATAKIMIDSIISSLKDTGNADKKFKITIYEKDAEAIRFKVEKEKLSFVVDKTTDKNETKLKIATFENDTKKIELNITIVKNGDRTETTIDFPENEFGKMSIKIVTSNDNTYEELIISQEVEGISVNMTVQSTREFKDVQIDKVNNAKSINDMTKEEFQGLVERVKNAGTIYYRNHDVINSITELVEGLYGNPYDYPYDIDLPGTDLPNADSTDDLDVAIFNAKFIGYSGIQPAPSIKSLMTAIISNNAQNGAHIIMVYKDNTVIAPAVMQSTVDNNKTYKVEFVYGTNGYINRINILEQ